MINGLIDGYFDYLELKGKLNIGDYDVLKMMFNYVDFRVYEVINDLLKKIKVVL